MHQTKQARSNLANALKQLNKSLTSEPASAKPEDKRMSGGAAAEAYFEGTRQSSSKQYG